jgi:hypothetical protein
LGEFGDYFKTWNWETGFRYSADSRVELLGGVIDTNALRQALLDTNPATAFNPFGRNQNTRAVIDKIFVTAHHLGTTSLTLEDLKLFGDLNLPGGRSPSRLAVNTAPNALAISPTRSSPPTNLLAGPALHQPGEAGTFGPSIGSFVYLLRVLLGTFRNYTAWN